MIIKRLLGLYQKSYDRRPLLTLCCTNGTLGIIGDGLAQRINYKDSKTHTAIHNQLPPNLQNDDLPPPSPSFHLDFARNARFALYNFSVAPLAGSWYMFLDRFFPLPNTTSVTQQKSIKQSAGLIALKRMAMDQSLFAPAGLILFFTTMGIAETGTLEGAKDKLKDAFLPALITNYKIWPLVQWINFNFMPLPFRLPFVSSLGILWNIYLSWLNNASKHHQEEIHHPHHHVDSS
ncbi:uncharacterized protein BX664DRAFT_295041 [Halteromyces radiatus]|uniref:uncharacterized protein n=1 Tax=Halteromyces radiatus TaxID=101107 RepID=UPI0022203FC5|nr:uncharacterized protein BX664DRAFT_295041 [Halteromyces radiatus]KAI8093349.1 hypothetical protein BX664DRAFT_295041 [Halteromyces radiatus]